MENKCVVKEGQDTSTYSKIPIVLIAKQVHLTKVSSPPKHKGRPLSDTEIIYTKPCFPRCRASRVKRVSLVFGQLLFSMIDTDTPPTGAFHNALEIAQKDMPTAS